MNKVPVKDMWTQPEDTASLYVSEQLATLFAALTNSSDIKAVQDWMFPLVWRGYLRRRSS